MNRIGTDEARLRPHCGRGGRDVLVASEQGRLPPLSTRRGRRVHGGGLERRGFAAAAVLCLAGALAALAPLGALAEASLDTMLLWQVYDDYEPPKTAVLKDGEYVYIDALPATAARIRVTDGGYLDIYNSVGQTQFPNAVLPLDPDPAEGVFAKAGPVWSNLGEYADAAYAFTVELGNWEGDAWTVMATSKSTSYAELVAGGWTSSSMNAYPREGPWTPTFVAASVPEPTSGLLLLVGGALLALRRRKPQADGCAA